jgi:Family of unknown function (DUF5677)
MLYDKLLATDQMRGFYRDRLKDISTALETYRDTLIAVVEGVHKEAAKATDKAHYHTVAHVLSRHAISNLDGISSLITSGCVEPCDALFRTQLESIFGVCYLLKADQVRRGQCYCYCYFQTRLRNLRLFDSKHPEGIKYREMLKVSQMWKDFLVELDAKEIVFAPQGPQLEASLKKPPFDEIEKEWKRLKYRADGKPKSMDPNWYSFYQGPAQFRDLAKALDQEPLYINFYKLHSEYMHAGNGLNSIKLNNDGSAELRPLRHPGGMKTIVGMTMSVTEFLCMTLINHYFPAEMAPFSEQYKNKLRPAKAFAKAAMSNFEEWKTI